MFVDPSPSNEHATLGLIEFGLSSVGVAIAFAWPGLGSFGFFRRIERFIAPLARKKTLSVVLIGLSVIVLRLAMLPICPIPLAFCTDDFSFLLAADTFLHGRLTNPTPAMWVHFETLHVDMIPTYMSMYFPAQGLLLAGSKLLFGNPWFGSLLCGALMCAAIYWMLQAWLPPKWALLGGMIAVIHLGLFSYWVNTYHAAGCICALGGALILGALPRLMKTAKFRYGLLIAIGIVLLGMTRPYEGMLLCLPVAFVLGHWVIKGKNKPAPLVLLRRAAFPILLVIAAGAWMGYYDFKVFGKATTLPYTVNRAQYAIAPYYVWQSPRPEPVYRHDEMRRFYHEDELDFFKKIHSPLGFIPLTLVKGIGGFIFFAGTALLIPLIMVRRVFLDRRVRFLTVAVVFFAAGLLIEIFMIPHYLAPFTAAFYALGLQCMRHLRLWKYQGKPVGLTLVRFAVATCFVMAGLRVVAVPLNLMAPEWPSPNWNYSWYGPASFFGEDRARMDTQLQNAPGKHIVLVRYSLKHNPLDEWVYNTADIDGSKVVWAREMSPADNQELFDYYKDRDVWLAEPDTIPARLSQYPGTRPGTGQVAAATH
jgi:hypothetical protein